MASSDLLDTCAACGTVRVDGHCPGCREAVRQAIANIDARAVASSDPLIRSVDKFIAYDNRTGHYWALDQAALNVFCVHCHRWMTDYTLINACQPEARP